MKKNVLPLMMLFSVFSFSQNPLAIPDTLSGTVFNLNIIDTAKQFYAGYNTNTFGINANYLGPTLFLNQGDSISMVVNNQLSDTTTIHWHGMHVSSANDGGPHTYILPNAVWNPKFKVRDKASTYWYHPHLHMKTDLHATLGAAGMIIVRDAEELSLTLPRRYNLDDFPVAIQSKAFDGNKQITIGNAYDSVMIVNGTLKPYLNIPAQVVRLRLLNASSNRVYNIGFTTNMTFYQIASDGGLLSAPVSLTRLRLAPGERAEILLNATGMVSQTINMMSYGSELPNGIYGASNPSAMAGTITGYSSNILNGNDFQVLQLNVAAQTLNPVITIPSSLANVQLLSPSSANITRNITFAPAVMNPNNMLNGPFELNGTAFNINTINYNVPLNNIEIWELNNQTAIAHPFHIHDVQFYIFEINGSAPPANMQGRKDVVLVPSQQTAKFVALFDDFCDSVIPYVYHCHMLPHEDEGMIGQFLVTCPTTGINQQLQNIDMEIHPNPSVGNFQITSSISDISSISIHDLMGENIFEETINSKNASFTLPSRLGKGIYFLKINTQIGTYNKKVILIR